MSTIIHATYYELMMKRSSHRPYTTSTCMLLNITMSLRTLLSCLMSPNTPNSVPGSKWQKKQSLKDANNHMPSIKLSTIIHATYYELMMKINPVLDVDYILINHAHFEHREEITMSIRRLLSCYWCPRMHQTASHIISYSLQEFQYETSRPPLIY